MRKILMASAAATLLLVAPAGAQQGTKSNTAQPGALKEAVQPPGRADFYTVRPADLRASDIIGMDVRNTANEDLGEIADVVIDDGKTIRAIVLDVGGFLGIGERRVAVRSEEHTSELQSPCNLVCRLLLEKKKRKRPQGTAMS